MRRLSLARADARLGRSPNIANKHYLQVRDHHFGLVTGAATAGASEQPEPSEAERAAHQVAQIAAPHPSAANHKNRTTDDKMFRERALRDGLQPAAKPCKTSK